ncbi:hypothetical protein DN752_21995 [Echinicola strongylocentroti]|uniref:Uncharacterized protein n=1 Tax=Echinicola strongylocentroti TaxID=1795355 RepID=A0A2Z4IQM2_9BACT|nr:hypothetical protein DN752_21995 [Echinicola strongylocentroti]
METGFTFLMFTLAYGLCFLSFYPEKYLRRFSYKYTHKHVPEYKKLRLTEPIFFSFLAGYLLAFAVLFLMP